MYFLFIPGSSAGVPFLIPRRQQWKPQRNERTPVTKRADVHMVWSHLSIFLALAFLGRGNVGILPRMCNTFQIFFWTAEKQHDENVTQCFVALCSLLLVKKKSVEFWKCQRKAMKMQPRKCHLPKWDQGRFDRREKFSLSPNLWSFFYQGQVVSSSASCLHAVPSWQLPAALLSLAVSRHCLKNCFTLITATFLPRWNLFP